MFITFEGIDFSGKTTQCRRLEAWLERNDLPFLSVREPGGTSISEHIRAILLNTEHGGMDPVTELLLFSSARSQLVVEKIIPALQSGSIVIADRFYDSTTAYQGFGRGIRLEAIFQINSLATHGIVPDLTIFLDLSFSESEKRRTGREAADDRMEQAGAVFYNAVRDGYLWLAQKYPERFILMDGSAEMAVIEEQIIGLVKARLNLNK
jgi:dTMP kinase